MATIEGKPAAEWFADAAKRQKKSNAYAKYTPEAKKPEAKAAATPEGWNREGWPKTAAPGQPGYRDPNAKKPMIGSMPKATEHASPAKPSVGRESQSPGLYDKQGSMDYAQRTKKAGINKAVEEARKKYDQLRAKNPPKPIAKPKEEMAKDIPAGKFWDESHARAAVREMKADDAKQKADEREAYSSTKRRYTGTTF
jgi:hypothetical protein